MCGCLLVVYALELLMYPQTLQTSDYESYVRIYVCCLCVCARAQTYQKQLVGCSSTLMVCIFLFVCVGWWLIVCSALLTLYFILSEVSESFGRSDVGVL